MNATLELASRVFEHCRPSAAKPFLLFSLHDLYKLFAGLYNFSKDSINTSSAILSQSQSQKATPLTLKTLIARLWCHESCRVFRDRLLTNDEGTVHFISFHFIHTTSNLMFEKLIK